MITARSQYDPKPDNLRKISTKGDKIRTKQSDLKDTDINLLFKRFERTGQLPNIIQQQPQYGDYSSVPDYQESLNIVIRAKQQFALLDVSLRNRFENDPAKFLEFCSNDQNLDEMEKLGLLKPEIVQQRIEARKAQNLKDQLKAKEDQEAAEKALITKLKAELVK